MKAITIISALIWVALVIKTVIELKYGEKYNFYGLLMNISGIITLILSTKSICL